jgi:thiamine-phosphate pyrophosphorylase
VTLPRIYPILDTELLERRGVSVDAVAAALLEGGAAILQFRHKGPWNREVFAAAETIVRLCQEAKAQFIVNDRADFARLLNAGLHVGQEDLPPRYARELLRSQAIMGFSTHNAAQLCSAEGEPADYLALGPIFATASKHNPDPIVGIKELRRCRALTCKPLVAIGGITLENAVEVLSAGADSLAILSGLLPESVSSPSLRDRMEEWRRAAGRNASSSDTIS